MIRLTMEQVLNMHRMLIAHTGGTNGIRDIEMLDMALNGAFQSFDEQDLYPTIEEKAARLAFSIVKNHPFIDGNKRIGLFVMLVFLELNGVELAYTQQELIELGLGVAAGNQDYENIVNWILKNFKGDN